MLVQATYIDLQLLDYLEESQLFGSPMREKETAGFGEYFQIVLQQVANLWLLYTGVWWPSGVSIWLEIRRSWV